MISSPGNKPDFDPDVPPDNPHNRQVARDRGLVYDPHDQVYRDDDGCPILDHFGQPLG